MHSMLPKRNITNIDLLQCLGILNFFKYFITKYFKMLFYLNKGVTANHRWIQAKIQNKIKFKIKSAGTGEIAQR